MEQTITKNNAKHQLFWAFFLWLVGFIVTQVVLFAIILIQSGGNMEAAQNVLAVADIKTLILLQLISQVLVFIVPALLYSKIITGTFTSYYHNYKEGIIWNVLLSIVLLFSTAIFIQCMIIDKNSFQFPEALKSFEVYARNAQTAYDSLIERILQVSNPIWLIVIFIMVAIMPAIGEEVLFRGMIQQSIENVSNNKYLAIFISGTLFGIIHFEFFNFFALCFMGYILGYIYAQTRNIWISIGMHFFNNSVAFLSMYLYKKEWIKTNPDETAPVWVIAIMGVVMCICIWVLHKHSSNKSIAHS